jgi:hypothetical protein
MMKLAQPRSPEDSQTKILTNAPTLNPTQYLQTHLASPKITDKFRCEVLSKFRSSPKRQDDELVGFYSLPRCPCSLVALARQLLMSKFILRATKSTKMNFYSIQSELV